MKFSLSRTYGVEIEFKLTGQGGGADAIHSDEAKQLVRELNAAGILTEHRTYDHAVLQGAWKLIYDSSAELELVSPPMSGEAGFEAIRTVCQVLKNNGARVDKDCGLHVHHGAKDFNTTQMRRLVKLYKRFEPTLDEFMPASRRGNENLYCGSISWLRDYQIDNASNIRQLRDAFYRTAVRNGRTYDMTRYHKLNLDSYVKYGTVEFRHHSGTLNATKIINWVILTGAMVDRSFQVLRNSHDDSFGAFQTVMGMYGAWVEDEYSKQAVTYYRNRRKGFGYED